MVNCEVVDVDVDVACSCCCCWMWRRRGERREREEGDCVPSEVCLYGVGETGEEKMSVKGKE